ncbi:IS110 family transposase [Actinomyces naeslundii]|uniref:IS110 family transposase n=1 Tax=Actinomyces naeslundii TaxID=1655 RepID=UPI000ADBFC5D
MTRRSGSSIRGEHVSHGGNKRRKRAMFLPTFASLRSDPVSRACYQGKPPWARPSSPWPTAAS